MLTYIIDLPENLSCGDGDYKHSELFTRGHIIPFVASEVICAELPSVLQQFFYAYGTD